MGEEEDQRQGGSAETEEVQDGVEETDRLLDDSGEVKALPGVPEALAVVE